MEQKDSKSEFINLESGYEIIGKIIFVEIREPGILVIFHNKKYLLLPKEEKFLINDIHLAKKIFFEEDLHLP